MLGELAREDCLHLLMEFLVEKVDQLRYLNFGWEIRYTPTCIHLKIFGPIRSLSSSTEILLVWSLNLHKIFLFLFRAVVQWYLYKFPFVSTSPLLPCAGEALREADSSLESTMLCGSRLDRARGMTCIMYCVGMMMCKCLSLGVQLLHGCHYWQKLGNLNTWLEHHWQSL